MKAVLISIQPKHCGNITLGIKKVEVRKTKPKIETPFKCYIYCTANKQGAKDLLEIHGTDGKIRKGNSKVIGEFVCDRIRCEKEVADGLVDIVLESTSCVSAKELVEYANGNMLYSWHISDLVIYDKPKELSEFKPYNRTEDDCKFSNLGYAIPKCEDCHECYVKRPPQSWCYVEELR